MFEYAIHGIYVLIMCKILVRSQVSTLYFALKKREQLNFLSPEMVVFVLFDQQAPREERQAIASQLLSFQGALGAWRATHIPLHCTL